MVRYVHHQWAAVVDVGVATLVTAPVVFGVRGLPDADGRKVAVLVAILVISALVGLLAVSLRSHWLGGEKGDFESAVPLTCPEAILPTSRASMRRALATPFAVLVPLGCLGFGLFWDPWAVCWGFFFAPERIVKGVCVSFWERRRGVLLWYGWVDKQPLGKDQFLYSSPRIAPPV
ncbi:hypothetical protein ACFV06_07570 [Streptomyces sp. NPDC059618]|uniref:hypothetical protein n=1 Tax=Streptomyces sp. NPDC059618 TaxID=3346887 RepID=UPI00368C7E08